MLLHFIKLNNLGFKNSSGVQQSSFCRLSKIPLHNILQFQTAIGYILKITYVKKWKENEMGS